MSTTTQRSQSENVRSFESLMFVDRCFRLEWPRQSMRNRCEFGSTMRILSLEGNKDRKRSQNSPRRSFDTRFRRNILFTWTRTDRRRERNPFWNYPMDRHRSSKRERESLSSPLDLLSFSYPSGRLAILRLRSPIGTVVFFDDTDSISERFLGSITGQGHLCLQPGKGSSRRLFTDEENRGIYSFDEERGAMEREHQWTTNKDPDRRALQIELNSSIELEYRHPRDIRLNFHCEKEEYRLQLGVPVDLPNEQIPAAEPKKPPRLSVTSTDFDPSQSLAQLKERVQQISLDWLEHCRMSLGTTLSLSVVMKNCVSFQESDRSLSIILLFLLLLCSNPVRLSRVNLWERRRRDD